MLIREKLVKEERFNLKKSRQKITQSTVLGIISVALILIMAILTRGKLFEIKSLQAIAIQLPILGLLSLAQMPPMITGGIDLSIISTANLSGIIAALIITHLKVWYGVWLGMIAAIGVSMIGGTLNGILVGYISIPAIIATLGTMIFIKGISLAITKGYVIAGFPDEFLFIGNGSVYGIPMPFIIFVGVMIFLIVLLNKTKYGLSLYMMGSNPIATLFSGVNNKLITFKTHLLTGFFTGIASLVMISRFNAAQANYGESYLLLTVLACMLGGVNPAGGSGKVLGVFVSVVVLQVVATAFNLLGFSSYLASALWGGILIFVIIINRLLVKNS